MTRLIEQQKHIAAWQASELSQVAYCRQHGLNSKTFSSWLQAYRSQRVSSSASTLIPVKIKAEASAPGSFFLRTPQGHTLELPADVSPQWLGQLLKCLD